MDNTEVRASVALAAYNGELYIRQQIESILFQLSEQDELIISVNPSTDSTLQIVEEYASQHSNVRIVKCAKKGLISNFNSAIENAKGNYIFLSDQDDIWTRDKLQTVLDEFERNESDLILHGRYVVDSELNIQKTVTYGTFESKFFSHFIKPNFCGCCMAFKKSFVPYFYPIPDQRRIYHDLWIGLIACIYGKISVIHIPLIYYRRHASNISVAKTRHLTEVIKDRLVLLLEIIKYCRKNRLITEKK